MKVAIVGAGVVGLSVASELLRAGEKVTIYDPSPGGGASNGNSRIFRQSHDDRRMVLLSKKNSFLWEDWEKRFGRELINRCGLFYSGPGARKRYELLQENSVPASWKKAGEIMPEDAVLWEDGGGSIRCPQVFSALLDETNHCIQTEEVLEISEKRVRTNSSNKKFDRIISLAGQGTEILFPEWCKDIGLRHVPHLRIDFLRRQGMPAWIDHNSGKYGLPGLTVYSIGGKEEDVLASEKDILKLARRLKTSLDPQPLGYTICPSLQIGGSDEGWRTHITDRQIVFAGGNSYKWAPLHGKAIASLAREEDPGKMWSDLAGLRKK